MPLYHFIWTQENEKHIGEHGISSDEFESVVMSPLWVDKSRSSDRDIAFGYTNTGRLISCVYEQIDELTILPVTAFEEDER